jgi:hypothetical protein
MNRRTATALATLLAVGLVLVTAPQAGAAGRANHCINPAGLDLNEVYATNDAFVTPFCGGGHAGDWWRPLLRWVGASTYDVAPEGYEPIGDTPQQDFAAKLQSARYVIDAGSPSAQQLSFTAADLLVTLGSLSDDLEFVSFTPRIHPLAVGHHTIDIYVTMSADSWDGLGLEDEHRAPAGEALINSVELTVASPTRA